MIRNFWCRDVYSVWRCAICTGMCPNICTGMCLTIHIFVQALRARMPVLLRSRQSLTIVDMAYACGMHARVCARHARTRTYGWQHAQACARTCTRARPHTYACRACGSTFYVQCLAHPNEQPRDLVLVGTEPSSLNYRSCRRTLRYAATHAHAGIHQLYFYFTTIFPHQNSKLTHAGLPRDPPRPPMFDVGNTSTRALPGISCPRSTLCDLVCNQPDVDVLTREIPISGSLSKGQLVAERLYSENFLTYYWPKVSDQKGWFRYLRKWPPLSWRLRFRPG